MKVVAIIPTYNEKENIGPMLEAWLKIAQENPKYEFEILNVDGNSPDGTGEITKKYSQKYKNIHLLRGPRQGMGKELINGYRFAIEKLKADVIIPIDADFQFDPFLAPKLLEKIDEGYDVVVASRKVPGGGTSFNWFRRLTNFVSDTLLAYYWAGIKEVKDHAGLFKVMRVKGVLDKVDLEKFNVVGFSVNMKTLYELSKVTKKFYEVPAFFGKRRAGQETTVGLKSMKWFIKYVFETIRQTTKIRLERSQRFVKYAMVGFTSYGITALFLEIFYRSGLSPGLAASAASEIAIIFNFIMNNLWTFADKKITSLKKIPLKFIQFNLTSLGAVVLQGLVVGGLAGLFGDQWRQVYLIFAVGFVVIPYNYTMYNLFIWKTWKISFLKKLQDRLG